MKVSSVLKTLALMSILIQHTSLMAPSNPSPQEADSSTEGNGSERGEGSNKKKYAAITGAFAAGVVVAKKGSKGGEDVEVASE